MRVDMHAHYFPGAYLDEVNRLRPDLVHLIGSARKPGAGDGEAELEARFQAMDEAGVDLQIISAASNQPYSESEADAVRLARLANDMFAELVERHPARFRALAVLPLPHVDASLDELARALDELGMVGVTVGASVLGRSTCEPAFAPVYDEMNRRRAPFFGHAIQTSIGSSLLTDYPPVNGYVGAAFENTVFALHLVRAQIPLRFPDLKVVICHLGGALPIQFGRMDTAAGLFDASGRGVQATGGPTLPELPSASLRRFYYETTSMADPIALRAAYDAFGADHLLLGTDFPYSSHNYRESIEYIEQAGLPEADARKILDENTAQFFGLQ